MDISKITQMLSAFETTSASQVIANTQTKKTQDNETQSSNDTYTSGVVLSTTTLSSETYNDILEQIAAYKASLANETQETDKESTATDSSNTSLSDNSEESNESETTTEIIAHADGSVYLKTTTTTEGEEVITITKISDMNRPVPMQQPDQEGVMGTLASSLLEA
jgi:hypothetical protein